MASSSSTSITVRNIPRDTHEELGARAARSGRSLQEYLRAQLIELARSPDMGTLLARIQERKRGTGTRLPAAKILAHRDADRR